MPKYIYDIILHTSIGEKKGALTLQILDNRIDGFMDILGQTEPCYGTLSEHGTCELNGRMVTLMREIDYTAHGTLSNKEINLTLYGEHEVFQVTGAACGQEAAK